MKKIAILLLSIVLVVTCIAVVACNKDDNTTNTCEHKILDILGNQKSCNVVDLNSTIPCSVCGESLTGKELAFAVEHRIPSTLKKVNPTCTESGLTEGSKCLSCNTVLVEQVVIEALGHDMVNVAASAATCTQPAYTAGTKCSRCGEYFSGHEEVGVALGHDFSNGNYFTYSLCANGCGLFGTKDCKNTYESDFVYDFDEQTKSQIEELYSEIVAAVESSSEDVDEFISMFAQYDFCVSYIQAQYQFAQIANDIEYSSQTRADYKFISEYYNTTIQRYYKLFQQIDANNKYKDAFWAWAEVTSEEEKAEILSWADSYDSEGKSDADEILNQYEELMEELDWNLKNANDDQRLELYELYSQLVEVNNSIATTAEFNNYLEYAYANIYDREYSPDEVVAMRNYVRQYIGPLLEQVMDEYLAWEKAYTKRGGWTTRANQLYYSQFVGSWMWGNPANYLGDADRTGMIVNSRDSIANYFNFLNAQSGTKQVNFYKALSDLFENGNYFLGTNPTRTAYTWYIYSLKLPMLLFTEDYMDAFTFVHEFGHYYQFVYNDRLSLSMDHDETQSQGNEMLFLAWLKDKLPAGLEEGFEIMELEQLLNMLGTIVMSTAVDEFEYLVYTNATTFNGQEIAKVSDTDIIDYGALYTAIMQSYWSDIDEYYNVNYWASVVFDRAGYYISYAMSALPSLEIYAKAGNEGLAAARDSYLKLFTFADNENFVQTDVYEYDDGSVYVDRYLKDGVTYQNILNWAGLSGPFQEELYKSVAELFANR